MAVSPQRGKFRRFTLLLVIAFLVSGAGAAYFTYRYLGNGPKSESYGGPPYDAGVFTVDLLPDPARGNRLMKASVQLQPATAANLRVLEDREAEVRDAIVKILRNKTPSEISGKSGMEVLEQDIVKALNELLGEEEGVNRVFFPEFVMQ